MDLEATPAERKQLEYASQHFGFTPDSFIDTVTSFALDNLNDVMEAMKNHCLKLFKHKIPEKEIRESFEIIQEKYVASTEKVLDNYSLYVKKNILSVPQHVVLPEDRSNLIASSTNGTSFKSIDLVEELNNFDRLCQSSRSNKYKISVLEAKLENLQKVKEKQIPLSTRAEKLEEYNEKFESLLDGDIEALNKKMEVLRKLLAEMKENADDDGDGNKKRILQHDQEEAILAKRRVLEEDAKISSEPNSDKTHTSNDSLIN